jgi:hypothetical protein
MPRFAVITDAVTGAQTQRQYTPEEEAAADALQAATAQTTQITFAQLLIGLVTEGWITEAEGDAWLTGTPPAPVNALIAQLPQGQRFAAKARAIRPSIVLRNDPLVIALGTVQGKDPAQLDAFFNTYGAI